MCDTDGGRCSSDWGKDVITDVGNNLSNEWNNFIERLDNSWVGDAWGWVQGTAVLAAVSWTRNKAIPWVVGHARGAWSWLRTKGTAAWGWLKTKGTAAWKGFKGFLSSYWFTFCKLIWGAK